jgi:peptide/nickel transport system substrate-binding protein
MGTTSLEPPCSWFTANQIPAENNLWLGSNVTGYRSEDFDAACSRAKRAIPDEGAYLEAYHQTQAIFSSDLPAVPLYLRLRTAAARIDLCSFDLDPTADPLWNIEAINYGPGCPP